MIHLCFHCEIVCRWDHCDRCGRKTTPAVYNENIVHEDWAVVCTVCERLSCGYFCEDCGSKTKMVELQQAQNNPATSVP